jgi:hypothetical protein
VGDAVKRTADVATYRAMMAARRAFRAMCKDMRSFNIAGALRYEEQISLTRHITALGNALGMPTPNLVPKKEEVETLEQKLEQASFEQSMHEFAGKK